MQNATKPPRATAGRAEGEVQELTTALRQVFMAFRRMGPEDHQEKAAIGLLAHLIELGPVRVSDLADKACLSPSTVSRHITELEDAGYVSRVPDPDDKRAVAVQVTRTGKTLVEKTKAQKLRALEEAVDLWSAADLNKMSSLLKRLASDLENR